MSDWANANQYIVSLLNQNGVTNVTDEAIKETVGVILQKSKDDDNLIANEARSISFNNISAIDQLFKQYLTSKGIIINDESGLYNTLLNSINDSYATEVNQQLIKIKNISLITTVLSIEHFKLLKTLQDNERAKKDSDFTSMMEFYGVGALIFILMILGIRER